MNERSAGRIIALGGVLVGSCLVAVTLAADQPPGDLPAARTPSEGLDTPAATLGYALGLRIGSSIAADFKGQEPAVDAKALALGLTDGVLEARPRLSDQQIRQALDAFDARMREREQELVRKMREAAKINLAKATEFSLANGRKQGVTTRPSGLQYEIIRAGTGGSPTLDDTVVAHYRGTHIDGREFDATDPKGEPASFSLRGVVPGWQETLPLMKTGAKWRIYVPPQLGYGEEGSPPVIEPNELLIFEIELVKILPSK